MRWQITLPKMEDGFSIVIEPFNPFMQSLMNKMVVDILANPENYYKKSDEHENLMSEQMETDRSCDLCGSIIECGSFNAKRL
jgi:hypothetical protein